MPTFPLTHTLGQANAAFHDLQPGSRLVDTTVSVAGRVVSKREASGKLVFFDIEGDGGTRLQVMSTLSRLVKASGESDEQLKARFEALNRSVKLGDIIGGGRRC